MEKTINEQGELVIQVGEKTYYLKYGTVAYSMLIESQRLLKMIIEGEVSMSVVWVFYAGVKTRQIKNQVSPMFSIEDADDIITANDTINFEEQMFSFMLESMLFMLRQKKADPQMITIYQTYYDSLSKNLTQLQKSEEPPIVQESPQISS